MLSYTRGGRELAEANEQFPVVTIARRPSKKGPARKKARLEESPKATDRLVVMI